jgi:GTP1/Obg family GTP-binding protein
MKSFQELKVCLNLKGKNENMFKKYNRHKMDPFMKKTVELTPSEKYLIEQGLSHNYDTVSSILKTNPNLDNLIPLHVELLKILAGLNNNSTIEWLNDFIHAKNASEGTDILSKQDKLDEFSVSCLLQLKKRLFY